MKKVISLTLNRSGICETSNKSTNQCKSVGHTKYEYAARVTVEPKLDKNGFIIDHLEVHATIEKVFQGPMDSCEKLGMKITYAIEKVCIAKGCRLKKVYVKVRPIPKDKKDLVMAFMETEVEYRK